MRDIEKFKQDQEKGLLVKKMNAGSKIVYSTVINNAILRAARRKRISEETANRCIQMWDKEMVKRPQSLFWSLYAASQLLEVAKRRKKGELASARIVLCDVKNAIRNSRIALH